ncbi:MAG: O-antigen ligase family protein [Mariprofundaceae bacterium]|nr:O-antigen ligase family protein [Mariprofundaceae bacterium]
MAGSPTPVNKSGFVTFLSTPLLKQLEQATFWLYCVAAAAYPFSVAATNIALGSALGMGLINGQFAEGCRCLWKHHRALSIAWLVYLALLPIGLIWSPDRSWGLHIVARQWYWFIIPLSCVVLTIPKNRNTFLFILGVSLSLHLMFCVGQMLEIIHFTKDGSTAMDPTGHIGHIGFGFVYGVWAGWLLHRGLLWQGWKRWGAWTLATWAATMVFLAAGRSGYLVVSVLLLLVLWKLLCIQPWIKTTVTILAFVTVLAALTLGPGKQRMAWTWHSIQSMQQGDFKHAEARWSLWYAAIKAWQTHPFTGVGTGGYRIAAAKIKQLHPDLWYGGLLPAHPHNMYLLALSRWGPIGPLALITLLALWMRMGWRMDWQRTDTASLIALPGVAIAVHGLSAPSLEEHFSGILAALLLGAGLAAMRKNPTTSSPYGGQPNAPTSDA